MTVNMRSTVTPPRVLRAVRCSGFESLVAPLFRSSTQCCLSIKYSIFCRVWVSSRLGVPPEVGCGVNTPDAAIAHGIASEHPDQKRSNCRWTQQSQATAYRKRGLINLTEAAKKRDPCTHGMHAYVYQMDKSKQPAQLTTCTCCPARPVWRAHEMASSPQAPHILP
ncbi:uncharacterized protein BO97DRAFT_95078 [Aspergillus homomorphus CBS 101889]|uniref:Uncharacterized protein n=1 Tax=Aspergillus homomorphus (strain CBS 101889) TaxID=1450537 RepID=A0A395HVJ2_ASPHC|nr:hypothetical protein BO97DRAFT_95078 [Aspergillus homomorphus CBS 101889]RAL11433.1 hypothetical protein BO97DRAFT_95078 [Aspergillus homomorphus CBS 101889]